MADEIAIEPVLEEEVPPTMHNPDDTIPEGPPKRKGRQRLFRGLSRISSSPTLAQVGRARSASAPYGKTGSLSCVSLSSSASPFGQPSYFAPSSPSYDLSAASSIPGTPTLDHLDGIETRLARKVASGALATTPLTVALPADVKSKRNIFSLWENMPHEIKVHIFSFFLPKELVRISRVNKEFYKMCFDGQLWTCFDASEFYQDIPAESLAKIIVAAGPFVKDLNLRGCVQVEHYKRAEVVVKACRNLMNATLEGCRNLQKATLHSLLKSNEKLVNLNLTSLSAVTNSTCKIIAQSCPQLEMFNVSWCKHMDARGIKLVVEGCPKLRDLRAGEIKGMDSREVAEAIFTTNKLERLFLAGCTDLNDAALGTMLHGSDPEIDILTERPIVPCRKLRHLDLSRCTRLTTQGVKCLRYCTPDLEGLQLRGVSTLTDDALEPILASSPHLSHLDLEDLPELTNTLLSEHLAKAPCAANLERLSISYCENLGDVGMLPVVKACKNLRSIDMDNTRISDLVLAEAASIVRERSGRTRDKANRPRVGLSMVVYDCQNVTWTGIREVLSRNAEIIIPSQARMAGPDGQLVAASARAVQTFPTEIIAMKCFYGWQMTVDEHTKRVLRGDLASAARLERKWADYMQANEEVGAGGAGTRRRRRRAREAQQVHADEEEGGGITGRRRARTAACIVM